MNNNRFGLSSEEAKKRLEKDGENTLAQGKAIKPSKIFMGQFKDAMIIILLIATIVSFAVGEVLDAAAIIIVVVLNAILGFIQEYRAEKTLEALKNLSAPTAQVYRDGRIISVDAKELVVGDVIRLEAGGRIPADCRLINSMAFECDESLLTGESLSLGKMDGDECFMGTIVTKGHTLATVTATGTSTQMGLISGMLSDTSEEQTPLQKKLGELGKIIGIICIAICVIVSVLGILRGYDVFSMLLTGISLAVAAIPEGLPAVVTISLALAVRRIYKQKALVNKLHSIETLGCANVICTDKTGTLTQNKMTVTESAVFASGDNKTGLERLSRCAAFCNNAIKQPDGTYLGDPTEIALMEYASKMNVIANGKRTDEIPFDSSTRFMSVTVNGKKYLKGSLEVILPKCNLVDTPKIRSRYEEMTKKGLRCLAFAENNEFLGIMGLSDPLRPEVRSAVKKCENAGIKVIMLTGDHKNTAEEIAKQAGIITNKNNASSEYGRCVTGEQLNAMDDKQLSLVLKSVRVFARVSPGDKLRIVKALKSDDNIVAMTGDGVNDAPAVKEAAIGVSMGIQGTDVTKEAAQLVLLDDNFATLVNAIEQGRVVYDNIKKSIRYMLSSNIGEVFTMLFSMMFGMPIVLVPIQILLINLVTDGLPAIALGMEPPVDNAMNRPPRKNKESIFAGGMFLGIIARGFSIGVCTLGVFWLCLNNIGIETARTAAMATLGLSQLVFVFECKDKTKGIFNADYARNPWLILAVIVSALIIMVAILSNVLSPVLQTVPLDLKTLLMVLVFATALPIVNGLFSLARKR